MALVQKLQVLSGRLPGIEKVHARVRADRPVVVLARPVDPLEGLLVQEARVPELVRDLLHHFHGQLVVVHRDVGRLKDRRQLVLGRCHLVVLGLGRDAQLPELLVELVHVFGHLGLEHAKIVILHLLSLGRRRSHQRAAGQKEVFSLLVKVLVDQEILLLGTDGCVNVGDCCVAQKVQYFDSCI